MEKLDELRARLENLSDSPNERIRQNLTNELLFEILRELVALNSTLDYHGREGFPAYEKRF